MFVEDFSLNKDDQGTEYVTFEENPTKTRQGFKEGIKAAKLKASKQPRSAIIGVAGHTSER